VLPIALSLKWKAVLGATVLAISMLAVAGAAHLHFMRDDLRRLLSEQQFASASRVAQELDAKFENYEDVLVRLANGFPADFLQTPDAAQRYFQARPALLGSFDGLLALSLDGKVVADYPQRPNRAGLSSTDRENLLKVISTRSPVIGRLAIDHELGPAVQILVPIYDSHKQRLVSREPSCLSPKRNSPGTSCILIRT